ncbi:MAG: hypothetical protein MK086_12845, partial [Flavobacteriales bacterium]|nr:hypothetical protein [Flavobacteriales bacterium]
AWQNKEQEEIRIRTHKLNICLITWLNCNNTGLFLDNRTDFGHIRYFSSSLVKYGEVSIVF